jgi:hypothetical protein
MREDSVAAGRAGAKAHGSCCLRNGITAIESPFSPGFLAGERKMIKMIYLNRAHFGPSVDADSP